MSKATFQAGLAAGIVSGMRFPMVVEQKKKPVAYLYNEVRLPDINTVWTDELKKQYPCAVIVRFYDLGSIYIDHLYVGPEVIYFQGSNHYDLGLGFPYAKRWNHSKNGVTWNSEEDIPDASNLISVNSPNFIWTNTNILYADGSVAKPASNPIPVYE